MFWGFVEYVVSKFEKVGQFFFQFSIIFHPRYPERRNLFLTVKIKVSIITKFNLVPLIFKHFQPS